MVLFLLNTVAEQVDFFGQILYLTLQLHSFWFAFKCFLQLSDQLLDFSVLRVELFDGLLGL